MTGRNHRCDGPAQHVAHHHSPHPRPQRQHSEEYRP
ncbi:hypothetical protein STENM327S_03095 [Streptomyces tendae]